MAKEEKIQPEQNEALRGILDPIAPADLTAHGQDISGWLDPMRDLNPEYLANMDYNKEIRWGNQSFSQYWDDSSPEKQWTLGWMNEKYTGENTKNSDINYNANITTKDLNPNFVYGQTSKVYGTDHPWYISQRNDDIASALYNEWRVSKEEVQKFLEGQTWFFNSSEADRANTVESVWKRLWAIAEQNKQEEEPDLSKAEEIEKDYSWKIYWKTTAEEWEPKEWINTLADKNSVYSIMEAWRIANLKEAVSMDSSKIWYLIADWVSPFSEQTMRDMQQYYPEKYQEIQNEVKKIKSQDNVNSIASWWTMDVTSQLTASENNVTTSMNTYVNKTASGSWTWTLATNLNNALAQSEIVSWAREQMEVYKRKIVEIQQAAEELPNLANQYFKWDVPQYLVNAFINNRMQQYNKELEKYQNLYNASLDEAKLEISQQQWREEMNYKWTSLQADQNYKNANLELSKKELEYNRQKAAISNWQWNDDGSYSYVDLDWNMHTLSAEEAKKAFNSDLYNNATEYINLWMDKLERVKETWWAILWWQCEAFTDNFARQYFWTEMRWKNGWVTTAEEKAAYATEVLPQRWFIAVWDYWIKQKDWVNYWHTWIVIDYDPSTWKFTTLESNVKGDRKLSVQTHSINDPKLQWFRDPSQWENAKNWWDNSDRYYYYDTPMMDLFVEAYNSAKTAWVRNNIDLARESYSILNELNEWWYIDALINNDVLDTVMTNIKNRNFVDNNWNIVWDSIKQAAVNETQDPDMAYAIDRIHRLVEIKLRKESWAAINISEWLGNFDMYMPQVWQDSDYKLKRLQSMEHDMVSWLLPTPYADQYVPIIATDKITSYRKKLTEVHEDIKNKMNENDKNNWKWKTFG